MARNAQAPQRLDTVNITLSEELRQTLGTIARATGMNRSMLIRLALKSWLKSEDSKPFRELAGIPDPTPPPAIPPEAHEA